MNTRRFSIDLKDALHPDLAAEVEKQSVYISRSLNELKVDENGKRVLIECEAKQEQFLNDVISRFIDAMRAGFRPSDIRTFAKNIRKSDRPYETNVYQKLLDRNWVVELGPGQVALSGPALNLTRTIEQTIAEAGLQDFEAIERLYPTSIPTDALVKCGYMDSFPQHLSMVFHLDEDFDAIEQFRSRHVQRDGFHPPEQAALSTSKTCLCPALCYHSYPTLENRMLEAGGHIETSIGRIARYESSSMKGLDRLWEFTQRSIIWLGDDALCLDNREKAIAFAASLAKSWNVDCVIETANDPFFASVATAKNFWQRSQDLKLELRANVEPGPTGEERTLAAASFNLHGVFFGEAFNIKDSSGEFAASGCASWGLERWVAILFTQHGFDPDHWPDSLRDKVFL